MSEKTVINQMNQYDETLDLYTHAIKRAHGDHHPEVFEVRELFETMRQKITNVAEGQLYLNEEFNRLRTITHDYSVPDDVCQTYEKTVEMLSELDRIYYE